MTRILTSGTADVLALWLNITDGATLDVIVEPRADMEVSLTPVQPGDLEALRRIDQAESDFIQNGDRSEFEVSVPSPQGEQVGLGGNVTAGNTVIINGRQVTGNISGSMGGGSLGGEILVEARVPELSAVIAKTRSASLSVRGNKARLVSHETTSGNTLAESALGVSVKSVSGDVEVGVTDSISATTVSGDISVKEVSALTVVQSTAGDIMLAPSPSASGQVATVSGAITFVQGKGGFREAFEVSTVSGRVREW